MGVGILNTGLIVFVLQASLADPPEMERARTLAFAMLSFSSAGHVSILSELRTRIARWITGFTLATAGLLIQVPALARALHLVPLSLENWTIASAAAAAGLFPLVAAGWGRGGQAAS